jgi:hypothetical protein
MNPASHPRQPAPARPFGLSAFFIWLSGSSERELAACPEWERGKHMAFGATVLVPCLFAFIAASYALSTISTDPRVIYPVALVWSFIILTIDRALLASYRAYASFFRKVGQFALRLVVALLMGVTIAHPLVLLLFRDTVSSVIESGRQAEIEALRASYATQKAGVESGIAKVQADIEAQRERWDASHRAEFLVAQDDPDQGPIPGLTPEEQAELKTAIGEATAAFRERLEALETESAALAAPYATVQQELAHWQVEFEREVNGQRSGIVGLGPRARSIQDDHLAWRREEAKRLGGLLENLSREKSDVQSRLVAAEAAAVGDFEVKRAEAANLNRAEAERVAALRRKVQEDQAGQFVSQQNELRETIRTQIDTRLAEVARLQGELAAVAAEEQTRLEGLRNEPRRDILTQTLALHGLFKAGDRGGQFAVYTYLVLTMLFMLVDTIPILVKFFTKAGPYDALLNRDEVRFAAEHKAFLKSHHRYMTQLADGNLISTTRNRALEDALVDGVEHSRAAREFLDSLIELERSFNAKMEAEQAAAASAGPEKRAALEAMKQRFYDDLQNRMTRFFGRAGEAVAG